jgi:hypothetical protein
MDENFRKINKIKKFKNRREMKTKMKGWGGGTCETKLNAYTTI